MKAKAKLYFHARKTTSITAEMRNLRGVIYCLISPSGKRYVGQVCRTQTFGMRMSQYQSGGHSAIGKAIKKYGWDNFKVKILEHGLRSQNRLNLLEKYYIEKYDTLADNGKGYNMTTGGSESGEMSEQAKTNISAAMNRPEIKKRITTANKARWKRPGERAKQAAASKAAHARKIANQSEAERKKELAKRGAAVKAGWARRKANQSEAERKKEFARRSAGIKAAHARKKANQSEAERKKELAKRGAAIKASKASPEARARTSAAAKAAWKQPGFKEKRAASLNAANARPEVKERRSAATKAAMNRPEVKANHKKANANRSAALKAFWARRKKQNKKK